MQFWQVQKAINQGWNTSAVTRALKRNPDLKHIRTRKYCIACAKNGLLVRQDYSTAKERHIYSTYEVEYYTCPNCGKIEKLYQKVRGKGKGKSGIDSF